MKRVFKKFVAAGMAAALAAASPATACTGIMLRTARSIVHGRTLEFGVTHTD